MARRGGRSAAARAASVVRGAARQAAAIDAAAAEQAARDATRGNNPQIRNLGVGESAVEVRNVTADPKRRKPRVNAKPTGQTADEGILRGTQRTESPEDRSRRMSEETKALEESLKAREAALPSPRPKEPEPTPISLSEIPAADRRQLTRPDVPFTVLTTSFVGSSDDTAKTPGGERYGTRHVGPYTCPGCGKRKTEATSMYPKERSYVCADCTADVRSRDKNILSMLVAKPKVVEMDNKFVCAKCSLPRVDSAAIHIPSGRHVCSTCLDLRPEETRPHQAGDIIRPDGTVIRPYQL